MKISTLIGKSAAIFVISIGLGSSPLLAAVQCFSQAGTYGSVTVTETGSGCGPQLAYGGITGLWMGQGNETENCQFDFSAAVDGSTIEVRMTAHSVNYPTYSEETVFSMNGAFIAVTNADIDNTFPSGGVDLLAGTGGLGDPTVGGVTAAADDGRGTVRFSGAPASVTSLNIQHTAVIGLPNGTIYEICFDDEGSVVEPSTVATFTVTKDFTDDNDSDVEVLLSCNAGIPLQQNFVLTDPDSIAPGFDSVTFVLSEVLDGATSCTVTETLIENYTPSYDNGTTISTDGCKFESVASGGTYSCSIVNTPDPVDFYVDVTWEISDDADVGVGDGTMLDITCTDGTDVSYPAGPDDLTDSGNVGGETCVTVDGVETCTDDPVVEDVAPGESCTAMLSGYDSVTAVSPASCTVDFTVDGGDESCSFMATAFYEGIPTMSQWGMVLMALLMLGVGYVGMRRFI